MSQTPTVAQIWTQAREFVPCIGRLPHLQLVSHVLATAQHRHTQLLTGTQDRHTKAHSHPRPHEHLLQHHRTALALIGTRQLTASRGTYAQPATPHKTCDPKQHMTIAPYATKGLPICPHVGLSLNRTEKELE